MLAVAGDKLLVRDVSIFKQETRDWIVRRKDDDGWDGGMKRRRKGDRVARFDD